MNRWEGVLAPNTGHIAVHEAGAEAGDAAAGGPGGPEAAEGGEEAAG